MVQLSSRPVRTVKRRASSLATGRTPGRPRQTGQTWVFGGAPNSLAQPHHILDLVLSWTWVSRPITGSYSIRREIFTTDGRDATNSKSQIPNLKTHPNKRQSAAG